MQNKCDFCRISWLHLMFVFQIIWFHAPVFGRGFICHIFFFSVVLPLCLKCWLVFYMPVSRQGRIMWFGMADGRPHRFPHNTFSSVNRIFTKLGHMIPLWKNPFYFGVLRSKVTITINIIFDNRVVSTW